VSAGLFIAPLIAALVGFGGTIAIIVAAAANMGATPAETGSWIAGVCLAMVLTSGWLSLWHRVPVITAWSTPGAALIATAPSGITMPEAVGAFLLAAALIIATALLKPLGRLIAAIPAAIASAMLAGVLFRFVAAGFESASAAPWLVLPLVAVFLLARVVHATSAVLVALAAGVAMLYGFGWTTGPVPELAIAELTFITPVFSPAVLMGLGVPLYIVTMASQNLPGFAVLQAHGYAAPTTSALAGTGLASLLIAPLGAHTVNMAAISAAICMGPDVHPDKAQRWRAGVVYAGIYLLLAPVGASLVALFATYPKAFLAIIAGLALLGSLAGSLSAAIAGEKQRFAAVIAFGVTASGVTLAGVGSAFWGLCAGLLVLALDAAAARLRRG
jgi:benzoate membrane transport protein